MKRILACVLCVSLMLSGVSFVPAAEKTADVITVKDPNMSVLTGQFSELSFEGIQTKDIRGGNFQSSDGKIANVVVDSNYDEETEQDSCEIHVEPKKAGTVTVTGELSVAQDDGSEKWVRVEGFTIAVSQNKDNIVPLKDYQLYKAIVESADGDIKNTNSMITKKEIEQLFYLDASFCGIKDLSGIEDAINLYHLELYGNDEIENYSYVMQLKDQLNYIYFPENVPDKTRIDFISTEDITVKEGRIKNNFMHPGGILKDSDTITSDNDEICSVHNDEDLKLTGKKAGKANLILKMGKEEKKIAVTVEENPQKVTFDSNFSHLKIGHFSKCFFKGLEKTDKIQRINYEDQDSKIIKFVKSQDDDNGYIPVAVQEGTVTVSATIKTENQEEIAVSPMEFTVSKADPGIVPIKEYGLYDEMRGVDDNDDNMISEEEIKNVTDISVDDWRFSDLTGLDKAINLTKLNLAYTSVSNIDALKNLKKITYLNLDRTNVSAADRFSLIRTDEIELKEGGKKANLIHPKGLLWEEDEISAEDSQIVSVNFQRDEDYNLKLILKDLSNQAGKQTNLIIQNGEAQKKISVKIVEQKGEKPGFKENSMEVALGQFAKIPFKNADETKIKVKSSDSKILSIAEETQYKADGSTEIIYHFEPKAKGSVELTGEFTAEDGTVTESTMPVTVTDAKKEIVPLRSFYLYQGIENQEDESVDENQDFMISENEITKAVSIYSTYNHLADDDLQGLEQAVNCTYINLSGNEDITDVSIFKKFPKLEALYLNDTGISDQDKLSLLRINSLRIKESARLQLEFMPDGLFDPEVGRIDSEDEDIVEITEDEYNFYLHGIKKGTTNLILNEGDASIKIPVTVEGKPDDLVEFTNQNLLQGLLEDYDKDNNGYMTQDEVDKVKTVFIDFEGKAADYTDFERLPSLRRIVSRDYNPTLDMKNMDRLGNLKNLNSLVLTSVTDNDAKKLSRLSKLRNLEIYENVTDAQIEQLGKMTGLVILHLGGTFHDISELKSLNHVQSLDLSSDSLSDISGTSGMAKLIKLTVSSNSLSEISALKNLTQLKWIDICSCSKIRDISVLYGKKIELLYLGKNVLPEQQLEFADLKDCTLKKGTQINELVPTVRIYRGEDDGEEHEYLYESPYVLKAEDKAVIDEYGDCIANGETNVKISVKGTNVSTTIHVKVKDKGEIETVGAKEDKLPVLKTGVDQNGSHSAAVTKKDGSVYDVFSGEQLASGMQSYVSKYVYSDHVGFLFKAAISKDGGLFTGINKGDLSASQFKVDSVEDNYFITTDHVLYEVDYNHQPQKIDENVKQIIPLVEGYSDTTNIILYMDGTVKVFSNAEYKYGDGETVLTGIDRLLDQNYAIAKDGSSWFYRVTGFAKQILNKKIDKNNGDYVLSDGTLYYVNHNLGSEYEEEDVKAEKISDNVSAILPEISGYYYGVIYESGDKSLHYCGWEEDEEGDEKKVQKDITCEDERFVGICNGSFYQYGEKIMSDVADFQRIDDEKYVFIRTDGTVWKYSSPYLPEKMTEKKEEILLDSITLNKAEEVLFPGQTSKLNVAFHPSNARAEDVQWSSSNTNVAVVDGSGTITAKSPGTTVVTAKTRTGKFAVCKVTVVNPSLNKNSIVIRKGQKYQLNVTDSTGAIQWSCTNHAVAKVNSQGMVTAVMPGTAEIKAAVNGRTLTCRITVVDPKLNKSAVTLLKGKSTTLSVSKKSGTVRWSSQNAKIAVVNGSGKVTAKKYGTAYIKATVNGVTKQCKVKVVDPKLNKSKLTLKRKKKYTLKVKQGSGKITWKSSKKTVVTVNSKGKVTAKKKGTAYIYATINGKKLKCKVKVK